MSDRGSEGPDSAEALRHLCFSDAVFRERYEGFDVVGESAYSSVVVSHFLGCPVALKIFTDLSEEGRARFRTEFASAVRVTSPHAVRTYSAFERGPLCWIEMEAVEGTTLKDELARRKAEKRPFSIGEGLEIGLAVAAVLAEAHAAGIIHRDVKPANILLPRSGRPVAKLSDFGIARIAGGARLTATGAFPGTPHFGAPEAFAGRGVGAPADIYSFSLCLYAIFTDNGFPWKLGETVTLEALVTSHVRRAPRAMRVLSPRIPEALDALVLEGLEKVPDRRPTAVAMAERLARIPLDATPARRRNVSSRIGLLPALLMAAVLLGGGLVIRAVPSRGVSPVPRATPEPPREADVLDLSISVRGAFAHLANGPQPLTEVQVSITSEGGMESAFRLPGGLGAGETTDISLDAFAPSRVGPVRAIRIRGRRRNGLTVDSRVAVSRPPAPEGGAFPP